MSTLSQALEDARRGLLDLSTRNRLLALPKPGRSRGVVILDDEDADALVAKLREGAAFSFEAVADSAAEEPAAAPPPPAGKPRRARNTASAKAAGVSSADAAATREAWQADTKLRVRMPAEDLARRLRDIIGDARIAREESGIATLYLAIGALAWRDAATPETERLAPLALLPITLEREGVSQVFRLRADVSEVSENLSLREMFAAQYRLALPDFDAETYDPTKWAEAVAGAIAGQPQWRVEADALAVGLFSFAKFLMWRDLDLAANPGVLTHPLIRALVGGEALEAGAGSFPDDTDVDATIPVERLDHVMDMDGSQALAVEAVRRGGHLVIQGPPGTGKSQTIANIIAQAVLDGRTVLFMAEKLAALEVVQRRLTQVGLGAACLELHSEKQSKRAVLDELRATLATPPPPRPDREPVVRRLGALRGRINRHAEAMRGAVGDTGLPLHSVIGQLAALRARGVKAGDLALEAGAWDAERIERNRDAVRELAARAPGAHSAFAGVSRDLTPSETDRLMAGLPDLIRAFAGGAAALAALALALGRPAPGPAEVDELKAISAAIESAPDHDAKALAHPAWNGETAPLRALVDAQAALDAARADPALLPGALEVEGIEAVRATLAEPGGVFGFFSGTRRAAQAIAASVARDAENPLPALASALAGQTARAALAAGESVGRGAFGTLWGGPGMAPLLAWREAHGAEAARALAAGATPLDLAPVAAAVAAWNTLAEATALAGPLPSFTRLVDMLGAWATEPESLPLWQAWRRARAAAGEVEAFAGALAAGSLAPDAVEDAFDHALLESLLDAAMHAHPELAAFDGEAADRLVEEFREADRDRVTLARVEAAFTHAEALKKVRAGLPGMEVLRGEMEKKRGHLPVRELLVRARQAVQAAKPIFMMSPLSVAQFLAPPHGLLPGLSFDMLVMDEASQIEPVDALGAIARVRQVVVVGDDRQMPPTQFFQRMTGEDAEPTPGDAVAARDVESVLGLCNARGVPSAMLRWHYRSRHESLIAFSNATFYGGRLCVLPSPKARSAALGLSLVKVNVAAKGAENTEAKAVADAVIRHARETPGDTLGVAAFSIDHRDAIMDAVEAARRASPETEPFFSANPAEPFFIKNLENVQGDERDAIFISVGFVREAGRALRMNFGPVSAKGGERRLNVLVTRAKKRCVVFSDITAEDIDLSRSDGVGGEAALKGFLAYAADTAEAPRAGDSGQGAPLAALIGQAVVKAGKLAVPRVGLAGLFLDVAAKDGADYVLGIEADAGDWAALRCARDRERGRDAALAGMGWILARAWSLAWLARPEAEAARIGTLLGAAPPAATPDVAAPDPGLALPYAAAVVEVPAGVTIPDVPFAKLAEIVAAVVTAEAPVHGEVIAERMRLMFGRVTLAPADLAALAQAQKLARQLHGLVEEGGFWRAEGSVIAPRNRRDCPPLLRRIAMVAPAEIEVAAARLITAVPVATEGELAAGVQRLLGLDVGTLPAVAARVAAMAGAGRIRLRG
ncbi:MAG: damage-inducible protein [Rhodospirillales bacterium]|nr:damage-inducible protein [Rhodospirillales bacterium]